jgi:myo-inositol-1(or 4)-monophosphatase
MKDSDLSRALDIARKAAEAGAALAINRRTSHGDLRIESKGIGDFVTDIDHAAQKIIIDIIRKTYPDHRFLAEEEGADKLGNPTSPFRWIIDPLDGTLPYIHGKQEFGTIIALQEKDTTIIGVMILPETNDRFWAMRSGGTFWNDEPVHLRKTSTIGESILCTNMSRNSRRKGDQIEVHAPLCASLENYGCAAAEIGAILKGQNDGALFANGPKLWDIAAGCLLVEEAGGKARCELQDLGNSRGPVLAVASTKPIFEELENFVFGMAH